MRSSLTTSLKKPSIREKGRKTFIAKSSIGADYSHRLS